MFGYKARLGEAEIAHALDLKKRVVRRLFREGQEEIAALVTLDQFLLAVREASDDHKNICERCGVLRTSPGPCLRADACARRRRIARAVGKLYPLNIPPLEYVPADLWRMMHWKNLLPPGHDQRVLLGLSEGQWACLLQQKTLV